MDHRPKCKTQSYKSSTRKCRGRWPRAQEWLNRHNTKVECVWNNWEERVHSNLKTSPQKDVRR